MSDRTFCVLCDLDGTIADMRHRLPLIQGEKDWREFFRRVGDDQPLNDVIAVFHLLQANGAVGIIASGRSDECRELTEAWLKRYMVSYRALYMRRAGDHRPDYVVKAEMLDQIRADGYEPWVVLDDRDQVVEMWRSKGLRCLQVAGGDF